jgi:hypothetical protein
LGFIVTAQYAEFGVRKVYQMTRNDGSLIISVTDRIWRIPFFTEIPEKPPFFNRVSGVK